MDAVGDDLPTEILIRRRDLDQKIARNSGERNERILRSPDAAR